jgi:hypothetical protein
MDLTNTLWLDSVITNLHRKGSDRRSDFKGDWDGDIDDVLQVLGLDQKARDAFRREQRLAEACYEL